MVAVLAGALLIGGCFESEVPSYRYRLSVEVETPEGLKTGSSVIEVGATVAGAGTVVVNGRTRKSVRGEAVAVDLPDGQTLFALLRSENEIDWAANIMFLLSRKYRGDDGYERTVYAIRRHKGVRELPMVIPVGGGAMRRDGRPMLVTFGDEADPMSVEKVDPLNLAATFGEGVSLKRITVQATDDPVTTGIEERLGWIPGQREGMLDGRRNNTIKAENPLANSLSSYDFSKGLIR
ncbi:hypothetical protein EH31_14775 [Erythrobacter longus]|uniref:Uncharacterized protein n=2 Tax=Erythrobacter longus TaxID=1044 RepID=A0A074MA46_ERYLO|nr:hypothetical protein EH31_14775 [Erythrobacter longus]